MSCTSSEIRTDVGSGVQCKNLAHGTRNSRTCKGHRPTRSILSLRTAHTNNLMATLPSSGRQGAEGQVTGGYGAGERDYWGSLVETRIQHRQDQAVGAQVIRTESRGIEPECHCISAVCGHRSGPLSTLSCYLSTLYGEVFCILPGLLEDRCCSQ